MSEKIGEISDIQKEEALRDFLYDLAYENIGLELGQALYNWLEERK